MNTHNGRKRGGAQGHGTPTLWAKRLQALRAQFFFFFFFVEGGAALILGPKGPERFWASIFEKCLDQPLTYMH